MSYNTGFSQCSDLDLNDPVPSLWIDLSLREIRLLQTHSILLTRMRQFIDEHQSASEARRELLAHFPAMEQRSKVALQDARQMFKLARKYESSVGGAAGGDGVTRDMAARFATGRAGTTTAATSDTASATPQQPAATQSVPTQDHAPPQPMPAQDHAASQAPSSNAATRSSPLPPALNGNSTAWQSSSRSKRRTEDDSDSGLSTSSNKRQRTRGVTSGIGEKRTSVEPLDPNIEEGYTNKRRRVSAPASRASTPATSSTPPAEAQKQGKTKRAPVQDIKELEESQYGSSKRLRMSNPFIEPEEALNNWIDLDTGTDARPCSTTPQTGTQAHASADRNKNHVTAVEVEDEGSNPSLGRRTKRARGSHMPFDSRAVHVFASIEEVDEEL